VIAKGKKSKGDFFPLFFLKKRENYAPLIKSKVKEIKKIRR
jgi:hypothetical protein